MTLLLLFLQDQGTRTADVPNAMGAHTWFIILAVGSFLLWSVSYSLQLHKEALARKKGREELVRRKEQLLDQIAYTHDVPPARTQAVAFFSSFRDLTASGFWTTKMGIADLQYQGNAFLDEWNGCPEEALNKLGVKY